MVKCIICNQEFKKKIHNQKYCSFKCRNKYYNFKNRESQIKYQQSEKRKQWLKEYYKTDSYQETLNKIKLKSDYKERRTKIVRKYNQSIKGKINSINNDVKRKHNLQRIKHDFTRKELEIKFQNSKGICIECNKNVGINKLTIDHIIPISKAKTGFKYIINDIQLICKSCNSKKGNKIDSRNKQTKNSLRNSRFHNKFNFLRFFKKRVH